MEDFPGSKERMLLHFTHEQIVFVCYYLDQWNTAAPTSGQVNVGQLLSSASSDKDHT